jgi:hypothetical protein
VWLLSILAAHSFHIIPSSPIVLPIFGATSNRLRGILRSNSQNYDASEFDFLLREGEFPETFTTHSDVQRTLDRSSRRRMVQLPSSSQRNHVVLASSSAFPGAMTSLEETTVAEQEADPYANALDTQLGKIEQYQERQTSSALEQKLKSMDLQDIITTLFIPGVLVFVASRWAVQRVSRRVTQSADETLDNFANEMIYHDGDFKEMELCIKDYQKKLLWMGPVKTDAMIKRYLELYSKKKTVSPQAIASLSFVLTVFQFSEAKAASIFVQLCQQMGTQKISSIGKLLFLGSRIFKSEAGIKALQPVKTLIMSTYRDERVAESLVETSQQYVLLLVIHSEFCFVDNAAHVFSSCFCTEPLPKRHIEPLCWPRARINNLCPRAGKYWASPMKPRLVFGKPKPRKTLPVIVKPCTVVKHASTIDKDDR